MIKKITAILLAASLALGLTACSNNDLPEFDYSSEIESSEELDPNFPAEVDGFVIHQKPERIISLSPAITEILCELGYEDRLVGVTDFCSYPESVEALPSVGTVLLLDTEKIEELKPDLVIMQAPPTNDDLTFIQQTGADTLTVPKAYDIQSTGEMYKKLFTAMEGAVDGAAKGDDYAAMFTQRITTLRQKIESYLASNEKAGERLSAAYIITTDGIAATPEAYESKLMDILCLKNTAEDYVNWNYPVDDLVKANPDVLLYGSDLTMEALEKNKKTKKLTAVKKDIAYEVRTVIFERQSPRLADELERLARLIYPDAFTNDVDVSGESENSED